MADKTIRIGLGEPSAAKSTLWSVTVGGSEVYIAQRMSFSLAKISLHSSGRWRFAVNSRNWSSEKDRALVKWGRPSPVFDNWVLGPTIVFPPLQAKRPLKLKDQYDKKIEWLKPPNNGEERVLLVAFSKGESIPDKLLEHGNLSPDYVKSIPLKDRPKLGADTVWIISWLQPLQSHTLTQAYDTVARLKINYKKGGNPDGIFGVATPFNFPSDDERRRGLSPTIVEVLLGEHNIKEESRFTEGMLVRIHSLGVTGYITRIIGNQWVVCTKDIVVDPSIDNYLQALNEAMRIAKEKDLVCYGFSGITDDTTDVEILPRPK